MKLCTGIIPALLTPFTPSEDVDYPTLRAHVRRLLEAGVHGIFCLGTNGEFYALSEEEKLRIVETVVEEVNGAVPVYAGSGEIATRTVIRLTKAFMKLGADAVSVVTPYFINPTQEELYGHYQRIAGETGAPIVLYNIPMRTHVKLEAETVGRLSRISNIIGVKDSSGDPELAKAYIAASEEGFCVMGGNDGLILDTLLMGGTGAIAATANVIPHILVELYQKYLAGDIDAARKAQDTVKPLRDDFALGTAPGIIKAFAKVRGWDCGSNRMPIVIDSPEVFARLTETWQKHYQQ